MLRLVNLEMYSFMNINENGIAVHTDITIGLDMINKKAD